MLSAIHRQLPRPVKPIAERSYRRLRGELTDGEIRSQFVKDCFDDEQALEEYQKELHRGQIAEYRTQAIDRYNRLRPETPGSVSLEAAQLYYALVREHNPEIIVETGVCNGVSTLYILLALAKNGGGHLYSIDYPYRADESLEEFQAETFEDYGGAAIPADKDPGWIIPHGLHDHWTLRISKSQRELPRLLADKESIDMFVHDSEHSVPCMHFEYELAWEWLKPGGVLLSDDILANDAFSEFATARDAHTGRLTRDVGYMRKSP